MHPRCKFATSRIQTNAIIMQRLFTVMNGFPTVANITTAMAFLSLLFVVLATSQGTLAAPGCDGQSVMTCLMPMLSYFLGPEGHDLATTKDSMDYTDKKYRDFCRLGISFFDCFNDFVPRCTTGASNVQQLMAKTAQLIRRCDNPTFGSDARTLMQCMNTLNRTNAKTPACSNAAVRWIMNDVRGSMSPLDGDRLDLERWNSTFISNSICCNTKYYRQCSGSEINDKCGPHAQQVFNGLQDIVMSTYDCKNQTNKCPSRPDPSPADYATKMDFTSVLTSSMGMGGTPASPSFKTSNASKPSENRTGNRPIPTAEPTTSTAVTTRTNESSAIPNIRPCEGMWKYPENCDETDGCLYIASWTFLEDADAIRFVIQARAAGWTGIGFNDDKAMKNADAIIGWVTRRNTVVVTDRHCIDNLDAPMDEDQSVSNVAGRREDGYQVIEFTRKRDTNDTTGQDYVFSDENCPYFIFPVVGGEYYSYGDIQSHSQKAVPRISTSRICVGSCNARRMVLTFRLVNLTWTRPLQERGAPRWEKFEEEVQEVLRKVLGGMAGFHGSRVASGQVGSDAADVEITVGSTANQTPKFAARVIHETLRKQTKTRNLLGRFTVDPESLAILSPERNGN